MIIITHVFPYKAFSFLFVMSLLNFFQLSLR